VIELKKYRYKRFKLTSKDLIPNVIILIIIFYSFADYAIPLLALVVVGIIIYFLYKCKSNYSIKQTQYEMSVIDNMSGAEFECFLAKIYRKQGFKVIQTPLSCDYGADLILRSGSNIISIQAKRYCASKKVGVKAVQEVQASLNYYGAAKGIVVTNSEFTPNAIKLANINNVELVDRNG